MAAGAVGTVAAELPPPLGRLPGGAGTERALEEAEASGTLSLAGRRLRAFPAAAARRWDLSDTTQADLSRNRFGEVPEAACRLVSLEGLSLYHNCLRSVPPAIANLQALAHLDLSRNQLSSLPACLCLLPLRVLNASNNRLAQLPPNLGALRTLRQLVSAGGRGRAPRGRAGAPLSPVLPRRTSAVTGCGRCRRGWGSCGRCGTSTCGGTSWRRCPRSSRNCRWSGWISPATGWWRFRAASGGSGTSKSCWPTTIPSSSPPPRSA